MVIDEKAVFVAALALPDAKEREAYLQAACAGHPELLSRLRELLSAHEESQGPLDRRPAGLGVTVDAAHTERPGSVIGPYKLLQQIGEGGMGAVFMAEQTQPVQRKVALKVIKPGMDSRQVIARFEAERQALAMMDHVNIARVFDGGTTENGRPYFVMELVHGVPITKYCDDNHLTPRERLELFVPVCQAIQHAHQKGIIHRDVKPSNVMVTLYDGKPVPKVIDFGVAKATEQKLTERTLFTQYGTMVGTLEYMSPEQAEMSALGVDTRSDIFSLGVLLYELLTGSTPLTHKRMKEAAYAEILRMIKEEEPPRPSTRLSDSGEALASISANRHTEPAKLTKLVRGELDWIVMKTLEKDRNRRYETANGLAADVQRYLADEPVQACPPSAGYRFRKFARRNKAALVTATVIGVALLLAVGSLGWVVRDREAGRVRTAGEVNQFLRLAESHYDDNKLPEAVAEVQKARGVLDASSGDEDLGRRVRQWHTDLDTAAKLEEIRLEWYDLEDRDPGYTDYAWAFRDYGIDVESLPAEEATARVAASRIKFDLVLTLNHWAGRLQSDRRPQDPARWQRLLAISKAADSDPWRLRLNAAVEAKDVQTLRELANGADLDRSRTRTLAFLGVSLRTAGDTEAAVAFLRKAQRQHPGDFSINSNLAVCLRALKPPPLDEVLAFRRVATAVRPRSCWAHNGLGNALLDQNKLDEAGAEYRKAIELDPKFAGGHNNLGLALKAQGKQDEAIASYRKAIELDPKNAMAHTNLGSALRAQEKLDEAIAACRKAIEVDPKYAWGHVNLGNALMDQKKFDEAIACFRKAIEVDPKYAWGHFSLGCALQDQKNLDEAVAAYREAIELDPKNAMAHNNLGIVLRDQKKLDDAVAAYRKAIEVDPKCFKAHYNLGLALQDQKKLDEAITAYRTAIEIDPKYSCAHFNLGQVLRDQNKLDEAIAVYRTAIELDPKDACAHNGLGIALKAQGKLDEAIACYGKAIELDPKYAAPHNGLGIARHAQKKLDEAIACFRNAIELDPKAAVAHSNLGNAVKDQGKLDEAIASCRKAIELDPKYAAAHGSLGSALKAQGKLDEAIACFREAIELDPKSAAAHNNLGDALTRQEKVDEAVAAFRKAIELDPKNATFQNNLSAVLAQRGWDLANPDPKRSVAASKEAVELNPQSVRAWQNLGWVQYRAGNWKASIEALETSCKLQNPGDCCQWIVMSLAHGKLAAEKELSVPERAEHKAEARRLYDDAVKQIDRWGPEGGAVIEATRVFRAEAAELLGGNQALKSLEKLVAAQPNAWEPRVNLAQAYAKEGKWEEAAAEYTKATEAKPDAWEPWSRRAFFHFNRQQWDSAIADFSKAIDLAPQVHTNWWHRGHAYLNLAQWDKAAADFGKVVDRWPDGSEGWYLRAVALAQLKQPDKALADLRQAIAKGFNNLERLKNDSMLAPLRSREDFGKLVEELERKGK